tara:strand:+ start:38 stop:193 length:156 start_codon:yes stop_codon:yes gene_type:complete
MNDYYKKMGWNQKQIEQHISMMSSMHSHQLVSVVPQKEQINEKERSKEFNG